MISLMESGANDLIQPLLPAGFVTVGCEVSVKHEAPALSETKVMPKTQLLEADGRKLLFKGCVMHGDNVIGEGLHWRIIIKVTG